MPCRPVRSMPLLYIASRPDPLRAAFLPDFTTTCLFLLLLPTLIASHCLRIKVFIQQPTLVLRLLSSLPTIASFLLCPLRTFPSDFRRFYPEKGISRPVLVRPVVCLAFLHRTLYGELSPAVWLLMFGSRWTL